MLKYFLSLLALGCSSHAINLPLEEALRAPAGHAPVAAVRKGVKFSTLNSQKDLMVRLTAAESIGHFKSIGKRGREESVEPKVCTFGYQKRTAVTHVSGKKYRYETVFVRFAGQGKKGILDKHVSYSNMNYLDNFEPWDLSKSFGPIILRNAIKLGEHDIYGTVSFDRDHELGPVLEFRHTVNDDRFGSGLEKHNYVVKLFFVPTNLAKQNLMIKEIHVVVDTMTKNFWGSYGTPVNITKVVCSHFSPDA